MELFYLLWGKELLISIQFPLADLRGFVADTGRLQKPGWPLPTPDQEFVRSFGAIRYRPRGGLAGWLGENEICEAARSVRLTRSLTLNSTAPTATLPLRIAYRRFFFDGLATSKFELGLATQYRKSLSVKAGGIRSFLDRFLSLRVRIPEFNGNFVESDLLQSGKHLAHSYLSATTQIGYQNKIKRWFICPGMPQLFLQCGIREKIQLPYFTRKVCIPKRYEFELHHCLVPFQGGTVRMWFLNKNDYYGNTNYDCGDGAERRLRIYLQRLNSEHECLRLVLRNIMAKKLTISTKGATSDALQRYFNEATKRIGILEAKSADQFNKEICEIARESVNMLNPGQLDALNRVLASFDLRKNIQRKIEGYAKNWANITIIENVKENYMGDVFKDINQSIIATRGSIAEGVISLRSSGKEQIADAISQLDKLIAGAMEKELDSEKKKECADLLNGITEETNKQKQNKNVLRALGNTLFSIVTSVEPLAKAAKVAFDILKPLWS